MFPIKLESVFGRPKRWRAIFGGIDVIRPGKREATEAVLIAAQDALSQDYDPTLDQYAGYYVLIYCDRGAYCYRSGKLVEIGEGYDTAVSMGTADRAEVVRAARRHLAQMAWPESSGFDFLTNREDWPGILDHAHWIGFQRAYTAARGQGKGDVEAHAFACQTADAAHWLTGAEPQYVEYARERIAEGRR